MSTTKEVLLLAERSGLTTYDASDVCGLRRKTRLSLSLLIGPFAAVARKLVLELTRRSDYRTLRLSLIDIVPFVSVA